MYLGSVRFFKHLILSVIFLIIAGLLAATIFLALGNSEKSGEIQKLSADKDALQTLYNLGSVSQDDENSDGDADKIAKILSAMEALGIDNKDLVNTIYQNDKQAFDDVIVVVDRADDNVVEEPSDDEDLDDGIPTESQIVLDDTEDDNNVEPSDSPYADLYPHLYAEPRQNAEYIDDTDYIYLTFDDGPAKYTDNILMYLDKHGVKATFFVMPTDSDAGKDYLNRMLNTGHEIGVHTMSHDYDEIYSSVEAYLDDFNQAFNLVYEQTGYKPYLYRFPGGSKNNYNKDIRDDIMAEMTRRGFVCFDWNVDSRDAFDADWTTMYNSVLDDVAQLDRGVILFHDRPGGYNTVTVIEDIIKALKADPRGYTFSVITPQTKPEQF